MTTLRVGDRVKVLEKARWANEMFWPDRDESLPLLWDEVDEALIGKIVTVRTVSIKSNLVRILKPERPFVREALKKVRGKQHAKASR